ncbi:Pentatricopeptide repeat-containing protein [Vitis vinifera]|uniref:Pentatricopeptide repeat-containing protein n=1 Tax=Vitis vinifera TaxID=29760 RepID=A0A438E6K8_VITVI|nr:Pentatricopeptide repeat-containing protein [Vitis vinifera]
MYSSQKRWLKGAMNMTISDQAIYLDLITKTRGVAAAENYFIDLPETSKNHLTYGALLNCYCKELLTEKAEALMERMKELKLGLSSMPYNSLMTLYTKIGQPEKIPTIIQEMKSLDIMPDSYTYNIWMRALAAVNDISGVERALKELEKRNACRDLTAFQFLITLYGRIGNLLEVYRVLVNLKDLPGAEKCFREWESGCSIYDIRAANALIGAYAKEGLLEKAEELKEHARRRGAKPNAKTWEIFLAYHLKNREMKQAVDCVANAISTGRGDGQKWVPSPEIIGVFMQHFEQEKDVDGAEGFLEILKSAVEDLGVEVFESLIRIYAAAGRTSPVMRRRLKMENVEVSDSCKKLLEEVSVSKFCLSVILFSEF